MEGVLVFFAEYLIETMTFTLVMALVMRFAIFKSSNKDEAYFSLFTRELHGVIDEDKAKNVKIEESESYLINILGRVNQRLPDRTLRAKQTNKRITSQSLREYIGSKHGLIASIQAESSVFNSRVPANWSQLTERIMEKDTSWSKVFGFIQIGVVTRFLDILPSMFIILGVFGTFIGISMALPEIARIDFSNLENSGETLTQFVINVTFAMRTSVAGIAFSIILTLLNTVFPNEEMRERTFQKVENSLQILWYHIQKDQTKEARSNHLLQTMVERLEEISQSLRASPTKKKGEPHEGEAA